MTSEPGYEVVVAPVKNGANIFITPPIPTSIGSGLHYILSRHLALANAAPSANVFHPTHVNHERYGPSSMIYVQNPGRQTTVNWMAERILLALNGNDETPPATAQELSEEGTKSLYDTIKPKTDYL